jgi:hypothetical protein
MCVHSNDSSWSRGESATTGLKMHRFGFSSCFVVVVVVVVVVFVVSEITQHEHRFVFRFQCNSRSQKGTLGHLRWEIRHTT